MKLKIELSPDSTKPECEIEVMKKLLMVALVLLISIAFVPTGFAQPKAAPEKTPVPEKASIETKGRGLRLYGEGSNDRCNNDCSEGQKGNGNLRCKEP